MTATTTSTTTRIQGWDIPTECPPAKTLTSWGTPKLQAAATVHPLAATLLLEKQATSAAYEAKQAEREARKAAKGGAKAQAPATNPAAVVKTPAMDTALAALNVGTLDAMVGACRKLHVGCRTDSADSCRAALVDWMDGEGVKGTDGVWRYAGEATPAPLAKAAVAPKAKAKAQEHRTPVAAPAPASVDAPSTSGGVAITYTHRLETATTAQLIAALVASVQTPAECDALANTVGTAIDARLKVLTATAEPTPLMAAKTTDAPKATATPKATVPPAPAAKPKAGELTSEQKAAEAKDRATLTAAYKAAKLPGYGTCDKWKLDTLRAKLATANAAPKSAAATPAPKPAHPALGTILVADGKGGTRIATLQEVYAALDAMTAPAAKRAA